MGTLQFLIKIFICTMRIIIMIGNIADTSLLLNVNKQRSALHFSRDAAITHQ